MNEILFLLPALLLAAPGGAQEGPRAGPGGAAARGDTADHAGHGGHAGHLAGGPAATSWTAFPLLVEAPAGRRERGAVAVAPRNLAAGVVRVHAPGPAPIRAQDLPLDQGRARVAAAPGIGSYHWVTATEERPGELLTASTVVAFADAGPAPDALLAAQKGDLEVVPELLPREHATWRETDLARFQVRFRGAPLPGAQVTLETERGSRSTLVAGADGRVTVLFPRDMLHAPPPAQGGGHAHGRQRRVAFVLGAEHRDGGRRYLTAFNWVYGPDPGRDRSLGAGLLFGLGGMLLAAPLLLRRPRQEGGDHA